MQGRYLRSLRFGGGGGRQGARQRKSASHGGLEAWPRMDGDSEIMGVSSKRQVVGARLAASLWSARYVLPLTSSDIRKYVPFAA